jgi:hypothetical protein
MKNKISALLSAILILLITACEQRIVPDESEIITPKFFLEKQTIITDNLPEDVRIFDNISARGDGYYTLLAATGEIGDIKVLPIKIYDDNTTDLYISAPEMPYKDYVGLYQTETGFTAVSIKFDKSQSGVVFDSYDSEFKLLTTSESHFPIDSFRKILYDGTDFYILSSDNDMNLSLRRFGSDFKFKDEPFSDGDSLNIRIKNIVKGSDGKVQVAFDSRNSQTKIILYSPVKTDTSLTEIIDEYRSSVFFTGEGDYLFFGTDYSYIYGYKSDSNIDTIMPISDFDLPYESIITEATLNGDLRTAFYSDSNEIIRCNFTLMKPAKDARLTLTLSVNRSYGELVEVVSAFNRISTKFKVEIDELGDRNNPTINGFDKALIDGTLGDILVPPDYSNVNYADKGVFYDLYEFMDKDESLTREEFIPNILEALETDGKLLRLWNTFGIETYLGPDNALQPTFDNIYKLINENPDKYILPVFPTSAGVLSALLQKNTEYFNDTEKLGSNEMRQLLEFCKKAGENPVSGEKFFTRFATGKGYYKQERFNTIANFIIAAEIEPAGDGKSVPVGNPIPSGKPLVYLYGSDIAINSASENKAAAWEFIKFYINFNDRYFIYFPVLSKDFEILAEETAAETVRLKEQYGENYSNSTFGNEYMTTSVRLPVREDFDAVLSLLPGAVVPKNSDEGLLLIITEEAVPYFEGEKSIEETLNIINDRAGTYISEKK